MTWERFDRTMIGESRRRLQATIRKTGDIAISVAAYEQLDKPAHMAFLHDFSEPPARLLALRPTDESDANAFKVCVPDQGRPFVVGRRFLTFLEVKVETATTWPARLLTEEADGPMLVWDINEPGVLATRGQGNRRAIPAAEDDSRPAVTADGRVYECHEKGCQSAFLTIDLLSRHCRTEHGRRPSAGERSPVKP